MELGQRHEDEALQVMDDQHQLQHHELLGDALLVQEHPGGAVEHDQPVHGREGGHGVDDGQV